MQMTYYVVNSEGQAVRSAHESYQSDLNPQDGETITTEVTW